MKSLLTVKDHFGPERHQSPTLRNKFLKFLIAQDVEIFKNRLPNIRKGSHAQEINNKVKRIKVGFLFPDLFEED